MAFTMANMKKKKTIFAANQAVPNRPARIGGQEASQGVGKGASQPPKNITEIMPQSSTMLAYSPIMNSR